MMAYSTFRLVADIRIDMKKVAEQMYDFFENKIFE
jgi:hypothetical protein